MEQIREWIEFAAMGVETLAVAIMMCFIIVSTTRSLFQFAKKAEGVYERYRVMLGRALLIGLELLVAADIIRTVALDTTPMSIALLGGLVVIRTALGWTLTVEVEGHWPWQKEKEFARGTGEDAPENTAP